MARLAGVSTDYYTRLEGMTGAAAMVQNGRSDVLAANLLGRALYAEVFNPPVSFGRDTLVRLPNQARFLCPTNGVQRQPAKAC